MPLDLTSPPGQSASLQPPAAVRGLRVLGWCLLVLTAVALMPRSAQAKPLQIMFLGDSITASEEGRRSYRYYLWRRLVDEKLEFDFIGTQHLNHGGEGYWPRYQDLEFDRDHEAYRGWRIDHIVNGKDGQEEKGNLARWLDGYTPDIAVVLLGTRDVLQAKQTEWAEREMRRVIKALRNDNDRVAIILVVPPPMKHENAGFLPPLATAYAGIAQRETTVNSPIRLVDLTRSFNPDTHLSYDGVQPNDAGERLIAGQVASTLLLLDESHLDPVRRTSVQAVGSVLVVPLGAALGFFWLARSQLRRERAAATYNLTNRGGGAASPTAPMSGRASRVSSASSSEGLTFPGSGKNP
ncbi:SGNH/GDSL hydrolase family protein [Algisphaera agarilytica]|uniref:Lysophospholipase L1-like esterase n=1 Tax=Algisphaera agarilytica TaxID=1385975 RepID=A0A7X0H3Z1_9BACT|nr:GDSL-type esterase/lipase family protein [Algisphaera agarilytica]MBB6428831.1 lysophospholipase L1-like esterase [Algisphaera agarilytica]